MFPILVSVNFKLVFESALSKNLDLVLLGGFISEACSLYAKSETKMV